MNLTEAWHAAVCGVAKSQTRLSDWTDSKTNRILHKHKEKMDLDDNLQLT